jgi:hypothetical protein
MSRGFLHFSCHKFNNCEHLRLEVVTPVKISTVERPCARVGICQHEEHTASILGECLCLLIGMILYEIIRCVLKVINITMAESLELMFAHFQALKLLISGKHS